MTLVDFAELELTRLRAVVTADRNRLERLHANAFVLCTPSGELWDRATYLDGLVSGRIDYRRFEPTSAVEVMASPTLAVVRYRSAIDLVVDDRAEAHLECWHLDVYTVESGLWRCTWSQATDTIQA